MPRFIVDECTGVTVVAYLREQGYDVVSVSEALPQADDRTILQYAVAEQRIVVTNDKDFGDMIFRDRSEHAGVILLRLANDRATTKIQVISSIIRDHADQLAHRFVVATERDVRIRPIK